MPENGFKVADAYADFTIDVDKAIGQAAARLKAKGADFERMGRNAGQNYATGFARGLDLTKGFDSEVAKVKTRSNQLQRTGNQAGEGYSRGFSSGLNLRSAMVEQVAVVKSARAAFATEGRQAGQAYSKGFGGTHLAGPTVSSGSGAEAAGEKMARDTADGFRKGSKAIDSEISRVGARANAQFEALKFAALSAGLPAAAAIGAAGVTAALTVAVGAFIGFGVKAAVPIRAVQDTWATAAADVTNKTQQMAGVFEGPLVQSIQRGQAEFDKLAPTIQTGMQAGAGYVDELTTAALNLARLALPGVTAAARGAGPVIDGLGDFAQSTGRGISTMFTNMLDGAKGAGQGMSILGNITEDLLGFTGRLLANLANNSGELNILAGTLDTVEGALSDATAAGSGTIGMLHGATLAGSGAITAISGLVSAAAALPPQLTQFAGSFTVASLAARKFGIDAGAGFEGLGSKIGSATGASGKLGAAVSGLAMGAINPAFLAVTALSIGLDILGKRQQEAAQAAAEHKENVRTLTDAIRQDNGAVGEAATAANVKALNDKNAANNVKAFGQNLAIATLAANNNADSLRQINTSSNQYIANIGRQVGASPQAIKALEDINNGLLQNGGSYDAVKDKASDAFSLLSNGMKSTDDLAETMGGHTVKWSGEQVTLIQQILNGTGAIGEQAKATREAQQAYFLAEQGATGLSEAQIKLRDSTLEAFNATQQMANSQLGYRGAVLNTKQALDEYTKTNKDGKASEDDRARALLGVEQAMMSQIDAAKQQAVATSQGTTEQQKNADGMRAAEREAVNLANAFKGPLPQSLQTTISQMSVTDAKAAGLKVSVNNLGQAVATLPNGKTITLTANTQAARDAVNGLVRDINGRVATITVTTRNGGSSTTRVGSQGAGRGQAMMADGGVLEYFADGGFHGLTPMGIQSRVVPPNTQRVIGDNPSYPEAFVPLNKHDASAQATLATANQIMGVDVEVPQRAGATVNAYITVNPPADIDVYALAAIVSRRVEQMRKAVA